MAIDSSKFFDSIRIKPNKVSAKAQAQAREEAATCEWAGCPNKGPHRAPKGRENSREYFHFCLNHVREYNQNYNFFQGMNRALEFRVQRRVHHAVALDPALPFEGRRHNIHPEMRLAAWPVAGMALMQM